MDFYCGWEKVRHLPELWFRWYISSDQLAGTSNFGDSTNDLEPWGVPFISKTFDQIMFTTNNLQHWIIFDKSTFTPGTWLNGVNVPNIRSSLSPFASTVSRVYYRNGNFEDPIVSLSDIYIDCLNAENSIGSFPIMR